MIENKLFDIIFHRNRHYKEQIVDLTSINTTYFQTNGSFDFWVLNGCSLFGTSKVYLIVEKQGNFSL